MREAEIIPAIMDIQAAAEVMGVHTDTIRRAIRRGDLPASMIAGRYRITREGIHQWLERNATTSSKKKGA